MASLAHYKYTAITQHVMAKYLPMWDWRWGPAQLYQESNWTPWAKSGAGAEGIAQFMPDTADEVGDDLGYAPITEGNDWRLDPELAIPAYAYYMHNLRRVWTHVGRSEQEIRRFTQAAYNCGTGNVLRAQRDADGALGYAAIEAHLSAETRDYVAKCQHWFTDLCTRP